MKRILILLLALVIIFGMASTGTFGLFSDTETSVENQFTAWASLLWTQTTEGDFVEGVLNNVDIITSPGDVMLIESETGSVTDEYCNESMIAVWSNLVETEGCLLKLESQDIDSTDIILPNSDKTIQLTPSGAVDNYSCVLTDDDDTSYVYADTTGQDLYGLDHVVNGNFSRVTIHIKAKCENTTGTAKARTIINIGPQNFYGDYIDLTPIYNDYYTEYFIFPGTNTPWTNGQLNSALIGVELQSASGNEARCTQVWLEVDYGIGGYKTPGTLTSTNLLSGITHNQIYSFVCDATAIPDGTNARVQFSQDNMNWNNSAGVSNGWDTLSVGINTIYLNSLGWEGEFYYRLELSTTVSGSTPVVDYISVNYANAFSQGSIASKVFDTGIAGATWDALIWDETLLADTDITFEVRASDASFLKDDALPAWTDLGTNDSPITSGLPAGQYMQWRATLTTDDPNETPILHEVRVWYSP